MTTTSTPQQRRRAVLAWCAVCVIWGTTYLAIRIALETMPPWLMAGFRWTAAGTGIALFLGLRGERLPPPSRWGGILLLGVLMFVLGNGGVVWAEQFVPSGLAALVVATAPFWMAAVEAGLRDGEALSWRVVIGLLVGFSGIVLLVWSDVFSGGTLNRGFVAGIVSLQIACAAWAFGSAYSRRHERDQHVLSTTGAQMIAGGLMMMVIGLAAGEWPAWHVNPRTLTALGYLMTVGVIGGFVCYTYALRHLPISFVSMYAYINPVIAVVLGAVILGEALSIRIVIAAALVLSGVAIVRTRRSLAPPASGERGGEGAARRTA
ncbi:MAG TPA: EamA family transporter [Vicinamibacterales bacterium]|nr:EamA family transporter [Vicinamibacterales bacterium]